MPTLHLHIGTGKTGTTSIQSFMTHNQKKLLQKGYLYPTSGRDHSKLIHLKFFQTIVSRRLDDPCTNEWIEEWESLVREIDLAQPDHIVISCEGICCLDEDEVKLLENYFSRYLSGFKIKIIIYLRRQDKLLVSQYGQRIRGAHYWGSIRDFCEETISGNGYTHGERLIRPHTFDYFELLKPWAETFGKDNIVVRSYERAKKRLIPDFLEAIDLSTDEDWQYFYQNQSRSGKRIKCIRLLNYIAREKFSMSREECKKFTRGKIGKIMYLIAGRLPDFIISNELASDKELSAALKNFEDSNRKVAQHYLGSAELF